MGFGIGVPNMAQMQQMMQNPDFMREILNNPMVQSMLNNPELLRSIIQSNPQMREILERNPDIAHALNDPAILRQTMEVMRNPGLMQEMMRNTDRAMANLENLPGGFDALRRMYQTVQEPLMQAAQAQTQAAAVNPFAAFFGAPAHAAPATSSATITTPPDPAPTTTPLPNPWAPPAVSAATGATAGTGAGATSGAGAGAGTTGAAGFGGLGGMGGFGMLGIDMNQVLQLMQSPAVQQMIQQTFSNPAFTEQLINSNPILQQLIEANPQMRQIFTNPQLLQAMTNPQTLQAIVQMQQAMQQLQASGLLPVLGIPIGGQQASGGMDWSALFGAPPAAGKHKID
jgi:ubiquilin